MEKDPRKRLEEAADAVCNCQGCPSIFMYGGCKKECVMHEFYKRGAEYGYKEAIKQAKEWLEKENAPLSTCFNFENDMNKLWEDEK